MDLSAIPLMPDLVTTQLAFRHSLRSALKCLQALDVPDNRIQVRMAGPIGPEGAIVAQFPEPGEALRADVVVNLSVAGLGFFHHLPGGMREWGESEIGTRQIVELFDDPLAKTRYLLNEGARLFAIAPDDLDSCSRWMALFGFDGKRWPSSCHFGLATLLPHLHRVAGTEEGIRMALRVVLDLPIECITSKPSSLEIPQGEQVRPGTSLHRLGLDTVIGKFIEQPAALTITIGPLSVKAYKRFEHEVSRELVRRVLDLVMPCDRLYSVNWTVLDRGRAPKLGDPAGNSCLGLNTYLGSARERAMGAANE